MNLQDVRMSQQAKNEGTQVKSKRSSNRLKKTKRFRSSIKKALSPSWSAPRSNSMGETSPIGTEFLTGKSSSLIFPTGVDSVSAVDRGRMESESAKLKRSQVNLRLDQCEAVRFPFKKKLMLNNMNLTAADISMKDLCGTALGNSLNKLSLSGNRLGFVPPKLVVPGARRTRRPDR